MNISRGKIKSAAIWLVINTVITLLVFSFIAEDYQLPLWKLFFMIFIITNTVSILCNLSGYYLYYLFGKKPLSVLLSVSLFGSIFAAVLGIIISHLLIYQIFDYTVFEQKYGYIFPTILIAIIVTAIAILTSHLQLKKDELEKKLNKVKLENEISSENYSLSIKEDEKYHMIKSDEIIYLSSHGKKTTVHTCSRDFETNQLMKNYENKLSDNFVRIHRQFIINTKYLSQIKYYEGGRYMAYLSDEDESTLPVGRKVAPVLKEKLGI
ncbi:MAG: LytTR family transcriptional regulator DNA-binding domain-containing protein [Spirochaetes bacterium]|nr:LytTR family transcriptional regulator DNA-binding domain-containing protein [Spirochaetota bacterium]